MKKISKIIAVMLSMVFVLSLTSCSEDAVSDQNTVKLFANFAGDPAAPTAFDKYFFEKAAEATGVKIEWEIPPSSGYAERIQLMMASQEYPDAIIFPSIEDQSYRNAVESGVVIDLSPYISEEKTPNLLKYTYDVSWQSVKYFGDDRIMAIPKTSLSRNEGSMVRADFLKKIGFGDVLNRPNNDVDAAEFEEIARRMTFNDPDGNGKNDTYGYGAFIDQFTKQFGPIEFAPRLYGDIGWSQYPGEEYKYMTPRFSRVSDNYKKQLELTRRLYMDKVLDPDGPTLTPADAVDRLNQGRVGMGAGFAGSLINSQRTIKKTIPNAELGYIFGRGPDGTVKGNNYSTGAFGQWCIFNTCKNPESVIKLFEWILSDEGWNIIVDGVEGVNVTTTDGRKVFNTSEEVASKWARNMLRRTGDFNYFTGANAVEPALEYKIPELEKVFNICQNTMVFSMDGGFTPTVTKNTEFINYTNRMAEGVTKISTGALPVSEYDNLLAGWYKAGGEQYVTEMNEYIAKQQANKQ